jgi:ribosomal protein RSM22 (predicted rRNA methylase)
VGALAYAVTRMPATLAAARAVFRELRGRTGDMPVSSLLDLGTGPATTLWAAACELPALTRATLVEPNRVMTTLARQLLVGTSVLDRVETTWQVEPPPATPTDGSHDVVISGYVLTELDISERAAVVAQAWQACRHAVVVILPGSVAGFRALLDARRQLLDLGATVIAPCPHADDCPLPDDDWCHFGARVSRSSLHRRLKGGALPYEDEKFSYLIATRGLGAPAKARVLRRPVMANRRVSLKLCRSDGLRDETVTHSHREAYRAARKVGWGGVW